MGPVHNVNASVQLSSNVHVRSFGGNQMHDGNPAFHKRTIRILTWTYKSSRRPYWFHGRPTGLAHCNTPIPCVFSNNHSLYNVSDVIIFHTRLALKNTALPPYRLPHQHWITYLRETPVKLPKIKQPHNTWFNWTIAYTMHADIFRPYGMCLPTRGKVKVDPSSLTDTIQRVFGNATNSIPWENIKIEYQYTPINHANGKPRKVLWAVNNCRTVSRRETYVKELKRHIEIDIIGKCGDDLCEKNAPCINELFGNHKFYLAFENAFCVDYITEKVWLRLQEGIVPIVLGGGDYKSDLPVHSYIDVRDFSSPKALASYLHKLDNDDNSYNEYFAWKQNYTCHSGPELPGKTLL
ncbi:hypothetical protein NP493_217g05022 [Ridgeia piscesae]|uniref:Fucosyltransferase n=1 Tax=Ridgeia piscesae TaxID=27915 RepID=A0AAD9P0Q6_RIDPI|nr:hypothetical protein NP493_217g05022 [Ridgeia piscesae]